MEMKMMSSSICPFCAGECLAIEWYVGILVMLVGQDVEGGKYRDMLQVG